MSVARRGRCVVPRAVDGSFSEHREQALNTNPPSLLVPFGLQCYGLARQFRHLLVELSVTAFRGLIPQISSRTAPDPRPQISLDLSYGFAYLVTNACAPVAQMDRASVS